MNELWIRGEDFVSVAIGPFTDRAVAEEHMAWCFAANMGIAGTSYWIVEQRPENQAMYFTPTENRTHLLETIVESFGPEKKEVGQ